MCRVPTLVRRLVTVGAAKNQEQEEQEQEQEQELEELLLGEETLSIVEDFRSRLRGPMDGIGRLDALLGAGHGLVASASASSSSSSSSSAGKAAQYGLEDGIWQHSGWKVLAGVQDKLRDMPEMREVRV